MLAQHKILRACLVGGLALVGTLVLAAWPARPVSAGTVGGINVGGINPLRIRDLRIRLTQQRYALLERAASRDRDEALAAKKKCDKKGHDKALAHLKGIQKNLRPDATYWGTISGRVGDPTFETNRRVQNIVLGTVAWVGRMIKDVEGGPTCGKASATTGQAASAGASVTTADQAEAGGKEEGADVSKKDLTITGAGQQAVAATVVKLETGGGDVAHTKLEDNETIDPQATYLVTARCHKAKRVSGRELIEGVELKQKEQIMNTSPCDLSEGYEKIKKDFKQTAEKFYGFTFDTDKARVILTTDGCRIFIKEWQPTAAAVAAGKACGVVAVTTAANSASVADKGDDDPGVDDTTGSVGTAKNPVRDFNQTSHIDQGLRGNTSLPFPADPYFHRSGSWGQRYPDQWGLHRIGFRMKAGDRSTSLWPKKARPVVVAVVDTGIDSRHPELLGAAWVNRDEIPRNGKDDDRNGYVDDVFGWNFVDNNNDVTDLNGHGTVIAGIIAAWTNNGIGIAGVNPWARIMVVRAANWKGDASNFMIADAIRYAADNGARVINVSLGGERLRPVEWDAIAYAREKGAIVVAAAGNEGININNHSPAGLPGVITVGSINTRDERVVHSNWGAGVDIAAPGVDILSLRARGTDLLKFERKDYKPGIAFVGGDKRYYRLTGTSFAAPFVTGVASLILSIKPNLTAKQVTRMVMHSARDIDVPGWDQFTGYGLLDARAALAADPDFYILSRIFSASAVKKQGKVLLQVSGRARADKFARAWIEAGKGDSPTEWIKVSDEISKPVDRGPLALIKPGHFKGSKSWTLRLIVEHKNGRRREARFKLKLG